MTVASEEYRSGPYTGNGVTTVFDFEFRVLDEAHLRVIRTEGEIETALTLGGDYTVSGVGDAGGGSITMSVAPTASQKITILRDVPFTQEIDLENQGAYFAETIEGGLDLAAMRDQQLAELLSRTIRVPASNAGYNPDQLINDVLNVSGERQYAEDARDAAEAAASALGNQAHSYDSRALAAAATIPAGVNVIRTFGLAAVGDGGGAIYKRGTIAGPGAFLGTGGQYWEWANTSISADLSYSQSETSAVPSPLIRRLNNTLFASEFGAVGDDATNDYAALQAFITAATLSGKEGRFDPGKKYYVSGGDLTIAVPSLSKNFNLYGNGSQIRTNPAEFRTGLKVQHGTAVTRADEIRKVLISGLTINHYDNANALYGINVIGSPHVTIEGCSFLAGSDTGVANQDNHSCIRFGQSDPLNPDTGSFWGRVLNNNFKGGSTKLKHCIFFQGGSNAVIIEGNSLASGTIGVWFTAASAGLNANEAVIANGIRILNNDFEGLDYGIYVQGTAGWSRLEGLIAAYNRIESTGTVFFNYLLNTAPFSPPIIGPNYIDSSSWPPKYISNLNALRVDVRDEFVGHITQNPGSLAAATSFTLTPITVNGAVGGDTVRVETNGDLLGIVATGYVSAANTVTIRCSNPTSAAIDLPSQKWIVRVRPQY